MEKPSPANWISECDQEPKEVNLCLNKDSQQYHLTLTPIYSTYTYCGTCGQLWPRHNAGVYHGAGKV